ncbi:alpha/beta fold hydrolase [Gymnodinialimonas sp.]
MSVKHWGPEAPEEPGAEAALMLHCTLANGGAWASLARHLRGRLTLVAPDLLAHGDGHAFDPTRDFHDQATEAAARHLTPGMHLIGHSFGATIALRLALDQPERVKSLTLIEPVLFCAAHGPGRAAHDAYVAGVPQALAEGDRARAARCFLGLWGAEPFDGMPPARQAYITDRIWIPAATEPALLDDRARILPRLPQLPTPTLLLHGALSPPVIPEIIARLSSDIPNSQAQVLDGAAHMAPLTHPAATARAILGFLDQL